MYLIYTDYIFSKSIDINEINDRLFGKIDNDRRSLISPFFIYVGSNYVYDQFKKRYKFHKEKKINLNESFANENQTVFSIKF